MGITTINPPSESVSYLKRFLASVVEVKSRRPPARALEGLPSLHLRLAAPHPVFNLGTPEVASGGNVESCQMTAWRYMVLAGPNVAATVGFAASSWDEQPLHAYIGGQRMAVAIAEAIGLAERSARIRRGTFVLASIRLPSLQAAAIWLRHTSGSGAQDLFVPIVHTPVGFAPSRVLSCERWMQKLDESKQRVPTEASAGG
jgi:hypothetical protein